MFVGSDQALGRGRRVGGGGKKGEREGVRGEEEGRGV